MLKIFDERCFEVPAPMTDALSNILTRSLGALLPSGGSPAPTGFSLDGLEGPETVAQAQPPANATDARINGILMNARADHKAAIEPLLAEVRKTNPQALQDVMKLVPEAGEQIRGRDFTMQAESLHAMLTVLAEPSTAKEAAGLFKTLAGQNTHVIAGNVEFLAGRGAKGVALLDVDESKATQAGGGDTPVNGTAIMVNPFGEGREDFRNKKLASDPQQMMRTLRNEAYHAISANALMQKAAPDGALPEPFKNVKDAWAEIQGFNHELASTVQEAFPFGSNGSPTLEGVEKDVLQSFSKQGYGNLAQYFVEAYGGPLVKQAQGALQGEPPQPVSDLLRRFVAPNLSPQEAAKFDGFMNDLLDKTKTAIQEFERANPGVSYERNPAPVLDKVWQAVGGKLS
jgi:hypothetical protein